ncbi:MAG: glycine dehydrogenase (aminomethyl-transferring), partial [Firmicutes bacterium]|nr:glycine dehydrogenase (aminomethyl-transferring) [Bacillota bacterium]
MSEPTAAEMSAPSHPLLDAHDAFAGRHLGPRDADIAEMLQSLGVDSLDALIEQTIPADIRLDAPLALDQPRSERQALDEVAELAAQNKINRSFIGMGYHGTITPPVLLRNILENPLWYTPYTPYQAEIAQGRLEALLNFQTMVADLTGLPLANASLLDEATAAAEAMAMCFGAANRKKKVFFAAEDCHPQTLGVLRTRAKSMGIDLQTYDSSHRGPDDAALAEACGVLVQYPTTDGRIEDYSALAERVHHAGGLVVAAADILALVLLKPPGKWGGESGKGAADIAVGSTQRFGVPMGFGGPHAAYIATHEKYARKMPGRIVGVSKDAHGNPAYRLAIQTREQHIRRDKATSNICTAQVLLAIVAGMYAVWHGPEGLQRIAKRVHGLTRLLAEGIERLGHAVVTRNFFDTITMMPAGAPADAFYHEALNRGMNLRRIDDYTLGIALDETTTLTDVAALTE